MVKKTVNKIPVEMILNVIRSTGLKVQTMSAFHKCTTDVEGPARIYVGKTKMVSRVHFAGLNLTPVPGLLQITAQEAKELRMGSVRAELDFSQDKDTVLGVLKAVCETVKYMNSQTEKVVSSVNLHLKESA